VTGEAATTRWLPVTSPAHPEARESAQTRNPDSAAQSQGADRPTSTGSPEPPRPVRRRPSTPLRRRRMRVPRLPPVPRLQRRAQYQVRASTRCSSVVF
jgi:hypothetical protein